MYHNAEEFLNQWLFNDRFAPEVDEALGARTTSLTSAFRIADSSVTRQESVDRSSV